MYFVPTKARRYRKNCKKKLKLVLENLTGIPWHAAAKSMVLEFPKNSNHLWTLRAIKHRGLAFYESACTFNVCTQSVQQFVSTAVRPYVYASACNFNVVSSPKIEKMQSFCPRRTATLPSAGQASSDGSQLISSKNVNLTTFKTEKEMNSTIGFLP